MSRADGNKLQSVSVDERKHLADLKLVADKGCVKGSYQTSLLSSYELPGHHEKLKE